MKSSSFSVRQHLAYSENCHFSCDYREFLTVLPSVKRHVGLLNCSLGYICKLTIITKIALYLIFKSNSYTIQFII